MTAKELKAVTKATSYCITHLSPTKPVQIGNKTLQHYFGNESRNLSKFLRKTLLISTGNSYSSDKHICKTYRLNEVGLQQLMQQYNLTQNALEAHTIDAYWPEVSSGMYGYTLKSNRLWHPLQNIRSEVRDRMFKSAGYLYKYDIKTAAPSIITQLANQVCYHWTEAIYDYLRNPKEHRQRLETLLGIDKGTAKSIITGLFNGAQLTNQYTALGKLLTLDQLQALKQDKYISDLRTEIKAITKTLSHGGDKSSLWSKYFKAEKDIMDVALQPHKGRVFRVHDGFYTDIPFNTAIAMKDCKQKLDLWVEFT